MKYFKIQLGILVIILLISFSLTNVTVDENNINTTNNTITAGSPIGNIKTTMTDTRTGITTTTISTHKGIVISKHIIKTQ